MTQKFLKWGIYAIVFCLPLYLIRFNIFGIPTTILEIMIYGLFVFWLVKGFSLSKSIKTIKKNRLLFWVIFFIFLGVSLATLRSWDLRLSAGIWKAWFFDPILFFAVFVSVIKSRNEIKKVFYALMASGLVASIISLVYLLQGELNIDGRLQGFFDSPNYLAMYLAPILVVSLGLLIRTYWLCRSSQANEIFSNHEVGPVNKTTNISAASISRPENRDNQQCLVSRNSGLRYGFRKFVGLLGNNFHPIFLILNSVFLILILFCTGSFGAWIGIIGAIGLGMIFWLWSAKNKKTAVISAVLLITICIGLYFLKISSIQGKLSINSRLEIWQKAVSALTTYPIIGIGPGTFKDLFLEHSPWDVPQPHNLFLAFLLQTGVIGFIGFILLLFWFFRAGIKNLIYQRAGLGPGIMNIVVMSLMVYVLAHGLVDTTYWKNDLSVVFWMIVGMMAAIKQSLNPKS